MTVEVLLAPRRLAAIALATALLSGCAFVGSSASCRPPLSQAQCDDAIAQARAAVDASTDLWLEQQTPGGPIRLTQVWQACGDADCMGHLAGFAFVRMRTGDGTSLGRVVVCIDRAICGDEPISLGFP